MSMLNPTLTLHHRRQAQVPNNHKVAARVPASAELRSLIRLQRAMRLCNRRVENKARLRSGRQAVPSDAIPPGDINPSLAAIQRHCIVILDDDTHRIPRAKGSDTHKVFLAFRFPHHSKKGCKNQDNQYAGDHRQDNFLLFFGNLHKKNGHEDLSVLIPKRIKIDEQRRHCPHALPHRRIYGNQ